MTVTVKYSTRDGSARAGADYKATAGILCFEPGVSTQVIQLVVFEDDLVELYEDFFLDLSDPIPSSVVIQKPSVRPSTHVSPERLHVNEASQSVSHSNSQWHTVPHQTFEYK
jgi:hypothetical protein